MAGRSRGRKRKAEAEDESPLDDVPALPAIPQLERRQTRSTSLQPESQQSALSQSQESQRPAKKAKKNPPAAPPAKIPGAPTPAKKSLTAPTPARKTRSKKTDSPLYNGLEDGPKSIRRPASRKKPAGRTSASPPPQTLTSQPSQPAGSASPTSDTHTKMQETQTSAAKPFDPTPNTASPYALTSEAQGGTVDTAGLEPVRDNGDTDMEGFDTESVDTEADQSGPESVATERGQPAAAVEHERADSPSAESADDTSTEGTASVQNDGGIPEATTTVATLTGPIDMTFESTLTELDDTPDLPTELAQFQASSVTQVVQTVTQRTESYITLQEDDEEISEVADDDAASQQLAFEAQQAIQAADELTDDDHEVVEEQQVHTHTSTTEVVQSELRATSDVSSEDLQTENDDDSAEVYEVEEGQTDQEDFEEYEENAAAGIIEDDDNDHDNDDESEGYLEDATKSDDDEVFVEPAAAAEMAGLEEQDSSQDAEGFLGFQQDLRNEAAERRLSSQSIASSSSAQPSTRIPRSINSSNSERPGTYSAPFEILDDDNDDDEDGERATQQEFLQEPMQQQPASDSVQEPVEVYYEQPIGGLNEEPVDQPTVPFDSFSRSLFEGSAHANQSTLPFDSFSRSLFEGPTEMHDDGHEQGLVRMQKPATPSKNNNLDFSSSPLAESTPQILLHPTASRVPHLLLPPLPRPIKRQTHDPEIVYTSSGESTATYSKAPVMSVAVGLTDPFITTSSAQDKPPANEPNTAVASLTRRDSAIQTKYSQTPALPVAMRDSTSVTQSVSTQSATQTSTQTDDAQPSSSADALQQLEHIMQLSNSKGKQPEYTTVATSTGPTAQSMPQTTAAQSAAAQSMDSAVVRSQHLGKHISNHSQPHPKYRSVGIQTLPVPCPAYWLEWGPRHDEFARKLGTYDRVCVLVEQELLIADQADTIKKLQKELEERPAAVWEPPPAEELQYALDYDADVARKQLEAKIQSELDAHVSNSEDKRREAEAAKKKKALKLRRDMERFLHPRPAATPPPALASATASQSHNDTASDEFSVAIKERERRIDAENKLILERSLREKGIKRGGAPIDRNQPDVDMDAENVHKDGGTGEIRDGVSLLRRSMRYKLICATGIYVHVRSPTR